MVSIAGHPNPCLVAILLVCNSRNGSGAQILFHYPPKPSTDRSETLQSQARTGQSDDSSDVSDSTLTDEDELLGAPRPLIKQTTNSRYRQLGKIDGISGNPSADEDESGSSAGDSLFGFEEDGLVSLLAPDRTWHKRKFELGINDLTFVGRPVYVRNSGSWVRRKKVKRSKVKVEESASETVSDGEIELKPQTSGTDGAALETVQSDSKSPLTMFHVVFVMNPPPLEHASRVKDMYDHVIKKFSSALKWDQVHNDYVWKQSELILALRSSASARRLSRTQLLMEIMEKSTLAAAISTVYNTVASSRIASITMSPKVSVSLQIPPITSTSYLPSLTEPPIQPGLWLTTATDMNSAAADSDLGSTPSSVEMAKHYTLLLKAPPNRIAKDAQDAGGPLAQPLLKLVSLLRPTKSLFKLSASSQISLPDIQLLAHHLIYWRRAVAIPPLYQRDTYITSPNADLRKLYDASRSYEIHFPPPMPSLPKMLSALSGVPRPYGKLIPSKDHKDTYYLALAWMMRNGWVTQLRTFAYTRVDPSVKRAVGDTDRELRSRPSNSQNPRISTEDIRDGIKPITKRPSVVSHGSSDGRRSIEGMRPMTNNKVASLILNPLRATPLESRWLDFIAESISTTDTIGSGLSQEDRAEIQKYWPAFVVHFNGRIALETIPIRENLKRKFVWGLLDQVIKYDSGGTEEDESAHKSLLLIVRHW